MGQYIPISKRRSDIQCAPAPTEVGTGNTPALVIPRHADTPYSRGARRSFDDESPTLRAQRLQGLFHSLSKVLCIFRSHYLFAIGLGAIFSLRRRTPAFLHSTLKLRDSWIALGTADNTRTDGTGRSPSMVALSRTLRLPVLPSQRDLALQFLGFRFLPPGIQA